MNTLTRYILAEVTKVFLAALSSLTAIMLIFGVVKQGSGEGLGPSQLLALVPYILPDSLRYTLPVTALFAVCSVYGRMSAMNEIVAAKALGVHPFHLVWPTIFASALLSLVTVVMNDVAVSWGASGVQRVVIEGVEEIAYGMLRTHKSYKSKRFSITVKTVDGRRLILPIIVFQGSANSPATTVTAEEAELRSNPGSDQLTFAIKNATATNGRLSYSFDYDELQVPLQVDDRSGMPARLAMRVLPDATAKKRNDIDEFEQVQAARLACDMLTGNYQDLTNLRSHQFLRDSRKYMWEELHRLETEPYRRWANGFSCLCFVLVGVPLAIRRKNADFLTSFFLCFAPILVLYYPLMPATLNQAREGTLPPYSVWLGNVLLLLWSGWLMRRVIRC